MILCYLHTQQKKRWVNIETTRGSNNDIMLPAYPAEKRWVNIETTRGSNNDIMLPAYPAEQRWV